MNIYQFNSLDEHEQVEAVSNSAHVGGGRLFRCNNLKSEKRNISGSDFDKTKGKLNYHLLNFRILQFIGKVILNSAPSFSFDSTDRINAGQKLNAE
jgi:hypothetical protein